MSDLNMHIEHASWPDVISDILDELAYEGCRIFTGPTEGGFTAHMDFPENGYQRWELTEPCPTENDAIIAIHHKWRMDGHNTTRRSIDDIYARNPNDD